MRGQQWKASKTLPLGGCERGESRGGEASLFRRDFSPSFFKHGHVLCS